MGVGTTTTMSTPTQVGSATNWAYIDGGNVWMGATNTAGQLFTAGYHAMSGVTAQGTISGQQNTMTQVGSLTNWGKFSGNHIVWVSMKTDNTLWGAGSNPDGELTPSTSCIRK